MDYKLAKEYLAYLEKPLLVFEVTLQYSSRETPFIALLFILIEVMEEEFIVEFELLQNS